MQHDVVAYLERIERDTGRNINYLMDRAHEILDAATLDTAEWGDPLGPYMRNCHPDPRVRWASLVLHMLNEPLDPEDADEEVMAVDRQVMAQYRAGAAPVGQDRA
jgi:hypothetical protein